MNLQEAIRQSLRDISKEPANQESKLTLGDVMREALEKKGIEMTEEEKDDLTKEVEDKLEETETIETAKSIFKKSLPGISK